MCGPMLRYIRLQIRFEPRDMRAALEIVSRRTYENYESGKRSIPAELAERIRELYKCDRKFMANICSGININIGPRIGPSEALLQQQLIEYESGIVRIKNNEQCTDH